jgi:hypothetical protein
MVAPGAAAGAGVTVMITGFAESGGMVTLTAAVTGSEPTIAPPEMMPPVMVAAELGLGVLHIGTPIGICLTVAPAPTPNVPRITGVSVRPATTVRFGGENTKLVSAGSAGAAVTVTARFPLAGLEESDAQIRAEPLDTGVATGEVESANFMTPGSLELHFRDVERFAFPPPV